MWRLRSQAARNSFWISPYEIRLRAGLHKVIERRGWQLLRINGSRHIYGKTESIVRLSVPVHGTTPLKTGLLRHLMKLADLNDTEFR
jgi:predicted RNA binding protein YcfA (HicA-like mRNA interferase family)